jgi:flagella basal body P-ring formation protein FlgA
LRVVQAVAAGDPVRIRLLGQGFEIAATGVALSGAGEGQTVRVRTDNGRVLSGTARGRVVEIQM